MRFSEAFQKLGYTLQSVRQDWSACNTRGVCLTLWKDEIEKNGNTLWFDTRYHSGPIEKWKEKPGAKKQKEHIEYAMSHFNGFVDMVILHGTPGEQVTDADPWLPRQRQHRRWKITYFDRSSGHYKIELI